MTAGNGTERAIGKLQGTIETHIRRVDSFIEQTQEEKRQIWKTLNEHGEAIATNQEQLRSARKTGSKAGAGAGGGIAAGLLIVWEYIKSQWGK